MDRPFKPKYGTVSQVLLQLVVATHKLSVNCGIGAVALPLMPNVVLGIAVGAVHGLIVPQPALAWLHNHPRRLQSRDPCPQHLHVPAASLGEPEVVLSYFASLVRLLYLLVFV